MRTICDMAGLLLVAALAGCAPGKGPGTAPAREVAVASGTTETAVFGGGCFWCVEAVFDRLEGVRSAESGYAGGQVENPTYEQVCGKQTGHAEVVKVVFDPAVISYDDLVRIFFAVHDPTTLNRQGADSGPQYRSVIFTTSEAQAAAAKRVLAEAQADLVSPIVTEIGPLDRFWPAEGYHQEYFAANPDAGYCRMVIAPKLAKFEKNFRSRLKETGR